MNAKTEYRSKVLRELQAKIPGHATPSLLKAHDDLIDLGLRARVHPRATAGAIALKDAEDALRRQGGRR